MDLLSQEALSLQDSTLKELEFSTVLEYITKYCYTIHGKEIITSLYPTDDLGWLRSEHDFIDEMTHLLTEDENIPFEGSTDIRNLLHKSLIENSILNTGELLGVLDSIRASRLIKSFFSARRERFPLLSQSAEQLFDNILLEKHITEAIDEAAEIRDNASKELFRIRREIAEKSARLRSRIQKILKQVASDDMVMDEFITLRDERFVIPVKVEHKRHIPGIIHGVSQTGSTVFLEPTEVFEMNNEISLLKNEEKREIYKILSGLTAELRDGARRFITSMESIAKLDSWCARARYALDVGGIKPEITDNDELSMRAIRHPLLVQQKGRKGIIPLSIEFDAMKRGHLISGPNAGGKTVALKSIGLNLALALSGIFPLGVCRTNYRVVFSTIGDHQSIENDLSTFSSQILSIKNILSECTSASLVLIDEICSGTDPQEGSALAAGIMDTFIELKLFFVATTHQSTLKSYALSREEIDNASLEFDDEKLKPTYKFLEGIPGNSYAFILADSLGMNRLVLERARKYLGSRHVEIEESIAVLQRYRQEAEKLRQSANEEKQKAEKARLEYETKLKEIRSSRQKFIEEARKEATEIVSEANALIENTIREIREQQRPIADVKKEFNEKRKEIVSKVEKRADEVAEKKAGKGFQ